MTDDERAEQERQILAQSAQLQMCFMAILNDPALGWAQTPHIAAHACSELLGHVLRAIVLRDPTKTPWTLDLVDRVREFVLDAPINPVIEAGVTRH